MASRSLRTDVQWGKPLMGMLYVEPEGLQPDEVLGRWVKRGLAFV